MPRTKIKNELRRIAGRSRGPTAEDSIVLDARSEYEEQIDSMREIADADEIESDPLDDAIDRLENLVDFGLIERHDVEAARAGLAALFGLFERVPRDDIVALVESYDEIESQWDSYVSVKEQDRYDGKADDVQSAWDELAEAINNFCDQAEQVGIMEAES